MKKKTEVCRAAAAMLTAVMLLVLCFCPARVIGAAAAFSDDPDAIEAAADSVFMLEVYSSSNRCIATGSGFIAFREGLLVTNYHVMEDGAYIVAVGDDGDRYTVSGVCVADKKLDIAILHFDRSPAARILELDTSDNIKRSQTVVAIGSPAGLKNTVSIGNISAFYAEEGKNWIQFTAPISSGSSGGALFGDDGKVIGVTTATYASAQNINMAVRASDVEALYRKWDGKTVTAMNRVTGQKTAASVYGGGNTGGNTGGQTSGKVYVTSSGTKYHSNPDCSKMKNPVTIDLMDAIRKGYQPCGKCYR